MNRKLILLLAVMFILTINQGVFAHCQIPCGIYHDKMRIDMMEEHIQTMEKSMNEIERLQKAEDIDYNQLVRWVMNKEDHADYMMVILTDYFMAQRIKPAAPDSENYKKYLQSIELLHRMLVSSMKCKQTTDLTHIRDLRTNLVEFQKVYFGRVLDSGYVQNAPYGTEPDTDEDSSETHGHSH